MDRLWSPWRYDYIKAGSSSGKESAPPRCVFCSLLEAGGDDDESNFILHRASHNFVVLNLYPYISGHLLIVPFAHLADLSALPEAASTELMNLTKHCQSALHNVYRPHGFNLGMNLGAAAGAGVADHLHMHLMPRWTGDTNFMTTVSESRVLPEDLSTTYHKLRGCFEKVA